MINDEEFNIIASRYFAKIRCIGDDITSARDVDIPSKVAEMNGILERIKEVRTIQRRQRGEEDSKPVEPLIKDEKIRKAVRAWAEANGVDRAILGQINNDSLVKKSPMTVFGCHISFEGSLGLERGRNYTIVELCGEEEECSQLQAE